MNGSGVPRALLEPARVAALLEACARHDESALDALYRMAGPVLYAAARRELDSDAAAEAALVAVFVAVWKQVGRPGAGWAWLWSLVDRAVDQQRASSRTPKRVGL